MTNRKRKKQDKRQIDSFSKIIDTFKVVLKKLKQSNTPGMGKYFEIKYVEREIFKFDLQRWFAIQILNQRKKNYKPTGKVIKFCRWVNITGVHAKPAK